MSCAVPANATRAHFFQAIRPRRPQRLSAVRSPCSGAQTLTAITVAGQQPACRAGRLCEAAGGCTRGGVGGGGVAGPCRSCCGSCLRRWHAGCPTSAQVCLMLLLLEMRYVAVPFAAPSCMLLPEQGSHDDCTHCLSSLLLRGHITSRYAQGRGSGPAAPPRTALPFLQGALPHHRWHQNAD